MTYSRGWRLKLKLQCAKRKKVINAWFLFPTPCDDQTKLQRKKKEKIKKKKWLLVVKRMTRRKEKDEKNYQER